MQTLKITMKWNSKRSDGLSERNPGIIYTWVVITMLGFDVKMRICYKIVTNHPAIWYLSTLQHLIEISSPSWAISTEEACRVPQHVSSGTWQVVPLPWVALIPLVLGLARQRWPKWHLVVVALHRSSLLLQVFWGFSQNEIKFVSTLGSSGILSNCQSTTILQTSMKKKTRLGAILSNWSSIAKWEYRFSTWARSVIIMNMTF